MKFDYSSSLEIFYDAWKLYLHVPSLTRSCHVGSFSWDILFLSLFIFLYPLVFFLYFLSPPHSPCVCENRISHCAMLTYCVQRRTRAFSAVLALVPTIYFWILESFLKSMWLRNVTSHVVTQLFLLFYSLMNNITINTHLIFIIWIYIWI